MSDGQVKILSETYINNKQMLSVKCSCGNDFERDFEHLQRGQLYCKECSKKLQADMLRKKFDDVIQIIHDGGCEYISGEYKNNRSKLLLRCSCGNTFSKDLAHFTNGQNRCPDCGKQKAIKSKIKFTPDQARDYLESYGYTMIGEYSGMNKKVKCICQNGHDCDIVLSYFPDHGSSCNICARNNLSGENHPNYKGGVSLLEDSIRQSLDGWKKDIRNVYNHKCPITGQYGINTTVHHLTSLNMIFNDVVKELGININNKRESTNNLQDDSECKMLVNEIVKRHTMLTGILISKDIHIQFHKEYGYGNNTPQQFNDFLVKHYQITLDDLQKKYI